MTMFNIDNSKSYKTEDALNLAVASLGLAEARGLVVCNRAGRFTMIFSAAQMGQANIPIFAAPHNGFMVMN